MSTEVPIDENQTTTAAPVPLVRGCGRRIRGGIYAEVDAKTPQPQTAGAPPHLPHTTSVAPADVAPEPDPVRADFEACLLDPPIPVDVAAMGLSAIGVTLVRTIASDGRPVFHVFDIIGQTHYPNVASFIDEARAHGVSRRLSRSLDFSRLEAGRSRLVLIHARAFLDNAIEYFRARTSTRWPCPKFIYAHLDRDTPPEMCSSLYWEDLDGSGSLAGYRHTSVCAGHTTTVGLRPPDGVTPRHRHAIFASFPISRLAVISDPHGATHDLAARSASRSSIAVEISPV
jgi:hypothetical protein